MEHVITIGAFLAALMLSPAAEAKPLRVQVLSRHRADSARVWSEAISCDGVRLEAKDATFKTTAEGIRVAGGGLCRELTFEAPRIESEAETRTYRGRIRATVFESAIRFVNEVEVEDYLRGVLASEQLAGAPEAMKAQAVVSRTFALASRGRHGTDGFDLCDLAHCQVYLGKSGESPEAEAAVGSTRGIVLRLEGALVPVWFHSACGGATSSPREVFGEKIGWVGVGDRGADGKPLCSGSPDSSWTWSVSRAELAKALGAPDRGQAFEVVRRDGAGRVIELRSFSVRMSGADFSSRVGKAFGWMALRSLVVEVAESRGQVLFRGRGLGHGVGLCQWGSRALDKRGDGWRAILQHYFPGAKIGP